MANKPQNSHKIVRIQFLKLYLKYFGKKLHLGSDWNKKTEKAGKSVNSDYNATQFDLKTDFSTFLQRIVK